MIREIVDYPKIDAQTKNIPTGIAVNVVIQRLDHFNSSASPVFMSSKTTTRFPTVKSRQP